MFAYIAGLIGIALATMAPAFMLLRQDHNDTREYVDKCFRRVSTNL